MYNTGEKPQRTRCVLLTTVRAISRFSIWAGLFLKKKKKKGPTNQRRGLENFHDKTLSSQSSHVMSQRLTLYQALHVSKRTYIHGTKGRHELQVWKEGDMNLIKCIQLVSRSHENMFVTTSCLLPLPITHSFPTHIHNQAQHEAAQAILASHFSRSWMSAEPVLPPLALHSRNSTLRGNCENSNSLPFFPS